LLQTLSAAHSLTRLQPSSTAQSRRYSTRGRSLHTTAVFRAGAIRGRDVKGRAVDELTVSQRWVQAGMVESLTSAKWPPTTGRARKPITARTLRRTNRQVAGCFAHLPHMLQLVGHGVYRPGIVTLNCTYEHVARAIVCHDGGRPNRPICSFSLTDGFNGRSPAHRTLYRCAECREEHQTAARPFCTMQFLWN